MLTCVVVGPSRTDRVSLSLRSFLPSPRSCDRDPDLLVAGTASHVGKSTVAAGFDRLAGEEDDAGPYTAAARLAESHVALDGLNLP